MKPLRIAMFSDSAFPVLNGVSVSVNALVNELRIQGHSVHLYAAKFPGYRDPDPNTYRFRSMPTPWALQYPVACPPYIHVLKKFRRNTYDIVHTHTPFILGLVGLRWAESHELPIVSTYHTLYDRYAHYAKVIPRRYIRFRIAKHTNFYYNRVQHVITPTDASLKWLKRHSVDRPVTVIPTGTVSPQHFDRAQTRQRLEIHPTSRILLYVGRLAKEKNLEFLIQAVALILRADPHTHFWMVGDGPYRTECVALARQLGIGDRVRFVGAVSRDEIDRYYAAADLFVFPSISESQGLVIQEAMAHGLPAVAVLGGGASLAIESGVNGIVVRPEVDLFAEATLDILKDDRRYADLSEGARKAARNMSVPVMAQQVLNVYNQVLDQRPTEVSNDRFRWI